MFKQTVLCSTLILSAMPFSVMAKGQTVINQTIAQDTAITAAITAAYAKSTIMKNHFIVVKTVDQHVALTGHVQTSAQYEQAVLVAESTKGVKDVDVSNLVIKNSTTPVADTYTTAKVKGVYLKEKLFGNKQIQYWPIKVETKDSIVYLTGKVSTQTQRANLIKLARSVNGVVGVEAAIAVE